MGLFKRRKQNIVWKKVFKCTGDGVVIVKSENIPCFKDVEITQNDIYSFQNIDSIYLFKCPICSCFTQVDFFALDADVRLKAIKIAPKNSYQYSLLSNIEKSISDELF